jgi:putative phosphoesterase
VKLGIISDLHCNVDAVHVALQRMGDVDELLCVGDVVFEYRFGNEVVELLRDLGARTVLGNHDTMLLSAQGERARSAAHVRQANVDWLAAQPLSIEVQVDGQRLLMTHASPCPPHTQYVWPGSKEVARIAEVDADYVILGHTHAQMAERVGRALVINPGSVGDPRDHANGRQCSYAVLDTSTGEVVFDDFPKPPPAAG